MTSFFDDSQSQSTNSTSSHFNSFSSSSRIWSSSAVPSKSSNDVSSSSKYGQNGERERDPLGCNSSSQSFSSGIFFNGERVLHDHTLSRTLDDMTKNNNILTELNSGRSHSNHHSESLPNVISRPLPLLTENLNHLSSSSTYITSKSTSDPVSVSTASGPFSSLSLPSSYQHLGGYMQSSQVSMTDAQETPHSLLQHPHARFKVPSHESPMSHMQPHPSGNDLSVAMQGMHLHSTNHRTTHLHAPPLMHPLMDPLENLLGPFPCVRLRNMPYDANIEDVLVFFQGLMILDVVILPPPVFHGQPPMQATSEAFVLFANPSDFQMAFQRNRQMMRHEGLHVDVFQGKRNDYYAAVSTQFMHIQQHHRHQGGGARSPSPYEKSNTMPPHLGAAMPMATQHHGHTTGHQGSTGQTRPRPNRSDSRSKTTTRGTGRGGGIQVGEHTGFLRMRGLPFSTDKNDIFQFFEGYEPIEDSICLTYRSDGRATGEGYVAFLTPDHAEKAMCLHKKMLGSRYIELFISNKEEHGRAKAREPREDSNIPE